MYFYVFYSQIIPSQQPSSKQLPPLQRPQPKSYTPSNFCRAWNQLVRLGHISISPSWKRKRNKKHAKRCAIVNKQASPPSQKGELCLHQWRSALRKLKRCQATLHLVTACGLNSAASSPETKGWCDSAHIRWRLYCLHLSCCSLQKKPSRDGPFSAGTVASLIVFFVHGPVLKLAATATNQHLSSLLALFKAPQKEAGEWNKTLSTPAGFSGTKVLLFNHLRWN